MKRLDIHAPMLIAGHVTTVADLKDAQAPQVEHDRQVKNCAHAYHSALAGINETHAKSLKPLLKSVRSGWRKLPGRWTFRPGHTKAGTARRSIANRANRLVRYRGMDPRLSQLAQGRELVRSALELALYTAQPAGAALCTGAVGYMAFFDGQLDGFRSEYQSLSDLHEHSAQIADWDLLAAENEFNGPLDLPDDDTAARLNAQASQLALGLTMARSLWSAVLDADARHGAILDHIAGLKDLKLQIGTIGADRRSPLHPLRAALHRALSAVEAMIYIQGAYASYDRVAAGFANTTSAVRSAHARNCVCSP